MSKIDNRRIQSLLLDSRVLTGFLLLLSGFALLLPIFLVTNPFTVVLPFALFTGALMSAVSHLRDDRYHLYNNSLGMQTKPLLVLWFADIATIVILYHQHGFARTNTVNILTLLLYSIPVVLIIIDHSTGQTLGMILLSGIVHRALVYFVNPIAYGVDPHYHYKHARLIAESSSLEFLYGTKELYIPFYHLIGAIGSLILNVPVQQGAIFLVIITSITTTGTVIVYYLGKSYWGKSVGLLSAVLFITGDYIVGATISAGTTELGLIFFMIIIYSTIRYTRSSGVRHLSVFLFAIIALSFTHQASTFVAFFTVLSGLSILVIFRFPQYEFRTLPFIMALLLYINWTTTELSSGLSFFERTSLALVAKIQRFELFRGREIEGNPAVELGYTLAGPMDSTSYIHVLPMGMLFFFSTFGLLYWIRFKGEKTKNIICVLSGGITSILILIFGGAVLSLPVVPSRWFMHLYFLLAIPAGIGLYVLANLLAQTIRHQSTSLILLCLIILILPYIALMGGNLVSAIDDPLFNDAPGAERMSYTDSEVATVFHTSKHITEGTVVYGDSLTRAAVGRYYDSQTGSVLTINQETSLIDQTKDRAIIINRQHMYTGKAVFTIKTDEQELRVRGTVPLNEKIMKKYRHIYQAESDGCGETKCGLYQTQ